MDRDSSPLIEALRDPAAFDHSVGRIEVVETHISWVILTGTFAYKIKKPVDLGFLDFSMLAQRRYFCEEEVRLNRRLAPRIYLAVVPITQQGTGVMVDGTGEAIEYAVKMRQFDPDQQLDRLLERKTLTAAHVVEAAQVLARFHQHIAVAAPDSPFGDPDAVLAPMLENFRQLGPRLPQAGEQLRELEDFTRRRFAELRDKLAGRKSAGFVRECHGDAHLRNMALIEGQITYFDCIEFSEPLRWIDVVSEIAFLVMDLEDRGAREFARLCLNTYLSETGDYAGLGVLRFYQLYRALVRAKVEAIRMNQETADLKEQRSERESCEQYLALASGYTEVQPCFLAITHGLSGSGKTTLTDLLIEHTAAIRLRSDVERKRLFGLRPLDRSTSTVGQGIYSGDASEQTYTRLARLASAILAAEFSVIVDAAFLQSKQRRAFRELAQRLGVRFLIFDVRAPRDVLEQRVRARATVGVDASDAGTAVLENQLKTAERLSPDEEGDAIRVDGAALPRSALDAIAALHRR